jgi:hypothetical protein
VRVTDTKEEEEEEEEENCVPSLVVNILSERKDSYSYGCHKLIHTLDFLLAKAFTSYIVFLFTTFIQRNHETIANFIQLMVNHMKRILPRWIYRYPFDHRSQMTLGPIST